MASKPLTSEMEKDIRDWLALQDALYAEGGVWHGRKREDRHVWIAEMVAEIDRLRKECDRLRAEMGIAETHLLRDTKLRAVAAHFKLMGWEPGKMCPEAQFVVGDFYCVRHNDLPGHLLPPPDPRAPAVRVALEDALVAADLWLQIEGHLAGDEDDDQAIWRARIGLGEWYRSDTAADALLEAAYQVATASPRP